MDNDLISRSAVRQRFQDYLMSCEEAMDAATARVVAKCIYKLDAEPAVDAAPVVHGRWGWSPEYCKWICPTCGGREGECESPICKWCGARMDGDFSVKDI